jgi:tetratricopeptide (TPR) repeat protein
LFCSSSFIPSISILLSSIAFYDLLETDIDLNIAIALNPNYAGAYGNLGLVYQKMGNIEAAPTNLQKAQELFAAQGNTTGAEQVANILQQLP